MGVTVRYRGRLEDLALLEPLEDCVIDLALVLGGRVRIWRSTSGSDPTRGVKGVLWDLAPGAETVAFLFSPERWLVPLHEIEDAEEGRLDEPLWVSVKTQFAPVEAHVALIQALEAIRTRFIPDMEVQDEGSYHETPDLQELLRRRGLVERALEGLATALERDRSSPEAREDPEILATRIQRLAAMVHQTLGGPSEHPPAQIGGDDGPWSEAPGTEAEWDAFYAEQRRKQERVQRRIEEALAQGADRRTALEIALETEGIGFRAEPNHEDEEGPWLVEALEPNPEPVWDAAPLDQATHPLQQRATNLILRVLKFMSNRPAPERDPLDPVEGALMDVAGGIAQALGPCDGESGDTGWRLVQLKRALRGAAFARGALFMAKGVGRLDEDDFEQLHGAIQEIEGALVDEMRAARRDLQAFF